MGGTRVTSKAQALVLGVAAAVVLAQAQSSSIPTGRSVQTMSFGGRDRQFIVYLPNRQTFTGMMILLHGYSQDANWMYTDGEAEKFANEFGFAAVVPTGVDTNGANVRRLSTRGWNVDTCCGYPHENGVDSVGFIRALVHWMTGRITVNQTKVFAGGFSNGCGLAYHLACEASDVITGIGCHGSAFDHQYTGNPYNCNPQVQRPVYTSVGTTDHIYTGSVTEDGWKKYATNVLGCSNPQEVSNAMSVRCQEYASCPSNRVGAKYCAYSGLGHSYPKSTQWPYWLSPTKAAWEYLNSVETTGPVAYVASANGLNERRGCMLFLVLFAAVVQMV